MATTKEVKEAVLRIEERLWNPDDPASLTALHKKVNEVNGRTRENELRSKVNRYIICGLLVSGGGGVGYAISKITEITSSLGG